MLELVTNLVRFVLLHCKFTCSDFVQEVHSSWGTLLAAMRHT